MLDLDLELTYASLPDAFYARADPTPVASPTLLAYNNALGKEIGIDRESIADEDLTAVFAGNTLPSGCKPIAQAYAGHQFGHFTMLGDGRAHLLGERVTHTGERYDIQLKGSGQTPFSRRGDGRAVVGPMLREYLISEAMHALRIPTTRALAVVATREPVQRETLLPGAILTRVARSHIRVGTFEYANAQQNPAMIRALLDYTIERHHPHLAGAENKALALLEATIVQQADLVVHWMRVGFVHGVMNTDNTALSGETIDYGPCAFMDDYHPATVFSSIDHNGRYAYANQPGIILWNLTRFAEALLPAIDPDQPKAIEQAEAILNRFADTYRDKWLAMMRNKLGLSGQDSGDIDLVSDLLKWMQDAKADYTNTFLALTRDARPADTPGAIEIDNLTSEAVSTETRAAFDAWCTQWRLRLKQNDEPIQAASKRMQRTNPAVIPRNHQVEAALTAATDGELERFKTLLEVLLRPYEDRKELLAYQAPPGPEACGYQTFCGT
jgi:uncharacterized protein YdiU (UPF0061 family)